MSTQKEGSHISNKIAQYIQTARAKNIPDHAIKKKLVESQVSPQIVDSLLAQKKSRSKEEILKYIQTARAQKHSDSAIKQKLLAAHVDNSLIDELLVEPKQEEQKQEQKTPQKPSTPMKSEEYSRENDVFSQDEFEKLEQKEQKKSLLGRFNSSKKNDSSDQDKKEETVVELTPKQLSKQLSLLQKQLENENVENGKRDGKIDMLTQKSVDTHEQIEQMGEKVGELRSTVLGRERMFNKMEDDFSSVKYVVNTFKPENLDKRFNEVQAHLLKLDSITEKHDVKQKTVNDKVTKYTDLMNTVKNFENVLAKLEELKQAQKNIEKLKLDIDKTTSRMEVMFHNLEDSIRKINEASSISESNQATIRELMVSLSKLEAQNDFLVKKEDFELLQSDVQVMKKLLYDSETHRKK